MKKPQIKRKIKMTKKHLIFITLVLLTATLTLMLSGCGSEGIDLEGKNIVVFELNEGTLEFKTSSTNTRINYAYHPGTYILDPTEIPGYKLYRTGYNFTGWYTSPDCKPDEKWDFDSKTFDTETLTLYAGWEKAKVYSYTVCYDDGEKIVELGKYTVSPGDKFDDWSKYANVREDYTPIGFFSDPELTTPWDDATVHPGGDTDKDIKVYVSYMEGNWTLVDNYTKLMSAVNNGQNVYLTKDIDCEGAELDFDGIYTGIFEGNEHIISNFKVTKSGGALLPTCSLFSELGEGSVVRNVSFKNVTYELFEISEKAKDVKVSALSVSAKGTTVSKVTIEGKLITDYNGELTSLEKPFYEEDSTGDVSNFKATVTVEIKTQ